MRSFKIYSIWPQASKHVRTLTYFHNAVPLVWGSLRLAPIKHWTVRHGDRVMQWPTIVKPPGHAETPGHAKPPGHAETPGHAK